MAVGRESDENWEGLSEIGAGSETGGLKGEILLLLFYNESIGSCKAGNLSETLLGKGERILGGGWCVLVYCFGWCIALSFPFYYSPNRLPLMVSESLFGCFAFVVLSSTVKS